MKKTNIIALLVSLCILLTIMLSPALAAKNFFWPMFLPAITGGISLPPGTLTYPKTGAVLVRYDQTDSTDWIEIIGTEVSGNPSEPVTRIRGNISDSSFTLYYTNKKPVRFIYDKWTMDISYDADGNLNFTLKETISANQLNSQASVKAVTVDCSKSKEAYQSEFNRAKDIIRITMNIFAAMIQKEGGDPEVWLGIIFQELSFKAGFLEQLNTYSNTKEILASYDETCPVDDTCTSGNQTIITEGREWQRCDNGIKYTFEAAIAYCENLTLDEKDGWYLPSWQELVSLVYCSNNNYENVDGEARGGCGYQDAGTGNGSYTYIDNFTHPTIRSGFEAQSAKNDSDYWTTTLWDNVPGSGGDDEDIGFLGIINFYFGDTYGSDPVAGSYYVRCVR